MPFPTKKLVDEALEAALVRTAREIVHQGNPPEQTYQQLVQLYQKQSTLGRGAFHYLRPPASRQHPPPHRLSRHGS